jgi:hypothetical protein
VRKLKVTHMYTAICNITESMIPHQTHEKSSARADKFTMELQESDVHEVVVSRTEIFSPTPPSYLLAVIDPRCSFNRYTQDSPFELVGVGPLLPPMSTAQGAVFPAIPSINGVLAGRSRSPGCFRAMPPRQVSQGER